MNERLAKKLKTLPTAPGVYFHKSADGEVIYVGKAAVAKQAIALKSPVELVLPQRGKDSEKIVGIPTALEKSGGESILVIKLIDTEGAPPPVEESPQLRIPLGKISFLRRIKKSIFENSSS
jgi:hypothetical protein